MGDKNAKDLRKQLRNVVIEILPQVLSNAAFEKLQAAAFEKLQADIHARLDQLTGEVRQTLHNMQERQKDVQNYIMREVTAGQKAAPKSE